MDQASIKEKSEILEHKGLDGLPRVLHVKSVHLLHDTYIIESPGALQILLEPWIVGARLANLARESSVDFLRVAYDLADEFRNSSLDSVTEVVPLAGALYYSLAEAFETVFGETVNRCFIGAKRSLTPTGWVTELSYQNFEALTSEPLIIIGDTIATGGTIESIIDATLTHSSDVRAVLVYSIAGGLKGAIRLKQLADRTQVPIYSFFSNAIFGVEPNGTDMPWLHPGTIVSQEVRQRAEEAYGLNLGRSWCSIWDWGDRSKHPLKHLQELLERCELELSKGITDQTRTILERFRNETQRAIERLRRPLSRS
ncbi:MAG: hypothetical protein ACFFD9_00865 [Candidatus Thorarchaeota archaeon]